MSNPPPQVRRADRLMADEQARDFMLHGRTGRLATVSADGSPYCIPLLYVCLDGEILVHNTAARGHLRLNVDREPRVCFEVDEAGEVFDYGRFECDVSIAHRSVIAFGLIRIIEDRSVKQHFCDALMAKYHGRDVGRPKGFYPRLDDITVYAITIERLTGKETPLPARSEQWPARDNTKTPDVRAP
ncbi:Pyridoxamine 5'-phosphate oxidase [Enhydrobacter aerosaccus]|uniref:Pyridoxamine 5'-phosphate oxidase n=1 Tax=Enhydrobacter aerosaccus TaxID=225324 RepID=A0A1T4RJH9_9HYPH|nr:pyridoxamine 5'-phosphate oxidase family protein [Enhydrobacter aerosaccus]SKA15821.1 Pyridoxamine 5'-phosphate oxidase [Enhydrobacter aerosaccus]